MARLIHVDSMKTAAKRLSKVAKRRRQRNLKAAKQKAKNLTQRATRAELLLRDGLSSRGVLFNFQMPVHSSCRHRIVDFYLPRYMQCGLVVEVDGASHSGRKFADEKRTGWLKDNLGCDVIRFTNEQVEKSIETVLDTICSHDLVRLKEATA